MMLLFCKSAGIKERLCFTIFLLILSISSEVRGYRILSILPYNAKSHAIMFEELNKGLANRGHRVDVVGHFPLKKPVENYNDIINLADDSLPKLQNNLTYKFVTSSVLDNPVVPFLTSTFGTELCKLMDHPKLKNLIKNPPNDPPYDLLIGEVLAAHCFLALGQHLKVPVVAIVTSPMWPWSSDFVANPDNPAYVPGVFSSLIAPMSFWDRMTNTLDLIGKKMQFYYYTSDQDEIIRKHLGPHALGVREAERNVSLILVNSHYSLNGVRPFTAAVVEVGGIHIPKEIEPLPRDLEEWLDRSKDGFVYVSFGSMLKIESFSGETLRALYKSLGKLAPVRVLMKVAKPDELPVGLPSNVMIRPWIPQLAVLCHKNARVFFTHGGLMSTQEAIHCGVPMIGVPLFSDQPLNVARYIRKNVAVSLVHDELTEEKIDAAFEKVLGDPSYMAAAKKMSAEFRDRPMSPLDTGIFWVEYVARHGGSIIRSPAMDLSRFQIALIDVFGALILGLAVAAYLIKLILKKLFALLVRGTEAPTRYKKIN
ncbi:UDP-glucosyltransferase 2-like [Neodiprion virginianus]|uniref:UDP-glucosyltransferase 2-like n=1 Tax=Neodiprion virginianus TaxID=2961670 RepID=UPI001EE73A51|nr:UDP-glucosyltransferase 2-like [Neodiprion virginianus]XP_046616573.1 UDP-glucosyltransferase 2-like [Neodiprion virginianus]